MEEIGKQMNVIH